MHKDVSLIIFYKDNKILLQDRRNMSKFGEEWGFFGGRIEQSETPEQAVIRETKEELSYDLKKFRFVTQTYGKVKDVNFSCYVYIAPLTTIEDFQQKEGQAMALFTEQEALKLKMNQPDYEIIKEVFKFLRAGKNKLG